MAVQLINVGDFFDTAQYGGNTFLDEIIPTKDGGYKLLIEKTSRDPVTGAFQEKSFVASVDSAGMPSKKTIGIGNYDVGPSKALDDGSLLLLTGSEAKASFGILSASGVLKNFYTANTPSGDGGAAYGSNGSIALAHLSEDAKGKFRIVDILGSNKKLIASVAVDRDIAHDEKYSTNVTALSDGRYIVTWAEPAGKNGSNIVAQIVTSDGKAVGTKFAIGHLDDLGTPADIEMRYRVASLENGGFAVSYQGSEYYFDPLNPADPMAERSKITNQIWSPAKNGTFSAGTKLYQDPALKNGYVNSLITLSTGQIVQVVSDSAPVTGGFGQTTVKAYVYDGSGKYSGGAIDLFTYTDLFDDFTDAIRATALEDGKFALIINYENYKTGTHYGVQMYSLSSAVPFNINGSSDKDILKGDARSGRVETIKGLDGNDQLFGYGGNDKLAGGSGNDLLDGGTGSDRLEGGTGDDTYVVDNFGDIVIEAKASGLDTVKSTISYILSENIENLTLIGQSAVNGTGNAKVNVLIGNDAANLLDGGQGADLMQGMGGDDTYYVDSAKDRVVEVVGGGNDTIVASVSYSLTDDQSIENLKGSTGFLGGGGAPVTLTGNNRANVIVGGSYDDVLNGKAGLDILTGSSGQDKFVFDTKLDSGNVDRITDFSSIFDTIQLDDAIFRGLTAGTLADSAFKDISKGRIDADDRIVYNPETGNLAYDADGKGSAKAIVFATLGEVGSKIHPVVNADDFFIV